jgi:hypothetical protein
VGVRLIGYWRNGAGDGWPDPRDLVDEAWDEREHERVASYLEQGFIPWVAAGRSTCRLCGAPNGSAELTDGVYLWPEGLAHYVRDHSVRLPAEVVAHVKDRLHDLESLTVDRDWWPTATRPLT